MFGYDYFNVGPNFDLNSLDSIADCIQGVLDDYNSQTITYNQAAERLRTTACGGNSDNEIYDILITENPDAPNGGLEYDPIDDENGDEENGNGENGDSQIQGDTHHYYTQGISPKLLIAGMVGLGALILWKK